MFLHVQRSVVQIFSFAYKLIYRHSILIIIPHRPLSHNVINQITFSRLFVNNDLANQRLLSGDFKTSQKHTLYLTYINATLNIEIIYHNRV